MENFFFLSFKSNKYAAFIPVLVKSPPAILIQMLSKYGLECPQTVWCLDVTNQTNDHHGGSLDHGYRLHNFLLVRL